MGVFSYLVSNSDLVGVALNLNPVARGRLVCDPLELCSPSHDTQVFDIGVGHVPGLQYRAHPDLVAAVESHVQVADPAVRVGVEVTVAWHRPALGLHQRAGGQTVVPISLRKKYCCETKDNRVRFVRVQH